MLGHGSISEGSISEFPVNKVLIAIKGSQLPPDAQKAFRDFVKETYENLWNTFEELLELVGSDLPANLVEYQELIVEIIKQFL